MKARNLPAFTACVKAVLDMGTRDEARVVAIRHMTMGGQPYWEAGGITAFLDSAADHWAAAGDAEDPASPQIARRLRQLSVQLAAEAIRQHDWWAGHRPGKLASPVPASGLPGGAGIRTAIKYREGKSHLHFNGADLAAFLHAEADRGFIDDEGLFDRSSAARMAARYLHDTAEQLDLEAMLVTRSPSGKPLS